MYQGKKIERDIQVQTSLLPGTYFAFSSTLSFLFFFVIVSCREDKIIYAERRTVIESVYASGKIIAKDEHMIQAMTNGIVLEKLVHEGDTVRKGQILYILTREMPVIKVQSKGKNATITNLENLSLMVTNAPPSKDKYYILSDCDGLIYQANKEKGESVHLQEPLALVGSVTDRLASLSVDQLDIAKIKPGQLVLVKSDLMGDVIFEAEIYKIYPVMNESNQTFRIDISFNTQIGLPFIHQAVEGNIVIQRKESALVLPAYALSEGDSVRIRINGRPETIKINTGIRGIDFVEVTGNLEAETAVYANFKK